jgi:radical SAM superfamily enzyme YgiQ (UPF0313 family)
VGWAVRVLLVSTYELGHQPLHLARPAARLLAAGHEVRCLDLQVERSAAARAEAFGWAEAVGFSVPMHTAMRLALPLARNLRAARPEVPVCFYGLYAGVRHGDPSDSPADRLIAGEYEPALLAWVDALEGRSVAARTLPLGCAALEVDLGRHRYLVPARHLLPPLEAYARFDPGEPGEPPRLVGRVEASQGCLHRCRHCPVPVVYDGRIRVVAEDVLLADVEQLVAAGARHLSFGDPDFLNGPRHAQRVVEAVHAAFPQLSFDCTVKVEHVLRHEALWPTLARCGCAFVVSAFECVNDATLARLRKGHTAADAARAVAVLRRHGIEPRPSLLPFTPWTSLGDLGDLMEFVAAHDLVDNVDPVQYAMRLLVPQGSLLLELDEVRALLGPYDDEGLTFTWRSPDPRVDELQAELASLAERAAHEDAPPRETFDEVRARIARDLGDRPTLASATGAPRRPPRARPRITEPWFC